MAERVSAYLGGQELELLAAIQRHFLEEMKIPLNRSVAIGVAIRKAAEAYGLIDKVEKAEV